MKMRHRIDASRFWGDKARAADVAARIQRETARILTEANESMGGEGLPEGIDEAIERDLEAQRKAGGAS